MDRFEVNLFQNTSNRKNIKNMVVIGKKTVSIKEKIEREAYYCKEGETLFCIYYFISVD